MDPNYWTKFVELDLQGNSRFRRVRSTREAAECLENWPARYGAEHDEAIAGCREVLLRGAPRTEARNAFIQAAEASGIYMRKK